MNIDTKTLLDENRDMLDGTDCSSVGNPTIPKKGGFASRIMVARLQNKVTAPAEDNRPRVNNFQSREDEDPFSDLSLLDPADFDQKEDVDDAVRDIMERAKANGLPAEYHSGLEEQVMSHF